MESRQLSVNCNFVSNHWNKQMNFFIFMIFIHNCFFIYLCAYVLGRLRGLAGSAHRGLERWTASHVVTHRNSESRTGFGRSSTSLDKKLTQWSCVGFGWRKLKVLLWTNAKTQLIKILKFWWYLKQFKIL